MREQEIKLRSKMHLYVKECLGEIERDLREQQRFIFVQVDRTLDKERLLKKLVYELKNTLSIQENVIRDLTAFGRWEKDAHE